LKPIDQLFLGKIPFHFPVSNKMASELQELDDGIPEETAATTSVVKHEGHVDLEAAASLALPEEPDLSPAPECFLEGIKDGDRSELDDRNDSLVVANEDPSIKADDFIEPESNVNYIIDQKEQSCATISSSNDEYLSDIDEEEQEHGDFEEDFDDEISADDYDGEPINETVKESSTSFSSIAKTSWKKIVLFVILIASVSVAISMALVCGLTTKCKNLQLVPCERECGGKFPFGCNPDLPNTNKYFCHPNGGCFYANEAQPTPPFDGFCDFKTIY
jgi:hypothetical protein